MDYRTNILTTGVEANMTLLPDINGLYFGVLGGDMTVFDYTRYFEETKLEPIDYKVFMRSNKRNIELLMKQIGKTPNDTFYKNTDGHILVASQLVYTFLAQANTELMFYFNDLLHEILTDGVAYSNGFVYELAADKLPDSVLQDIIKSRKNDQSDNQ